MTEFKLIGKRKVLATKTTYHLACPYCRKRKIIRSTCGHQSCQYKHHLVLMRARRKTDQQRPTARKQI